MPVTDNANSPVQGEEGADPLQWVYALSAIGGLAITAITLYGWWRKGSL